MKTYAKLFEDFLNEEDPLADILGDAGGADKKDGGEDKDKEKKEEDPIKKMQDEEKKKAERAEDKFDEYIEKKIKELEKKFDEYPEIKEEIGKSVIDDIRSKDRVRIHNAGNDLIYLQVKYQKAGETDKVDQITGIKEIVDDLDRNFTSSKMM